MGWFCCPDNMYCAATAADCPFVAKKARVMKMAKNRQCGPDETSCPAGCCPEANWFCCPDNMYCAATAADCPFVAKKAQLMKMAKNRQCGPDETSCPAGCCPEANFLLPRQHVLCRHRCRLSLRCQEGPAHEDGQERSVDLMRPLALLAAALRPTGSAALTTCTVLLLLLTAPSELLGIICLSLPSLTK